MVRVLEDIGDDARDEAALFHLMYLRRRAARQCGRLTRERRRRRWRPGLPFADLPPRGCAGPAVEIGAPDDALLAAVAFKLFADRQITSRRKLALLMLARMERLLAALRGSVASARPRGPGL